MYETPREGEQPFELPDAFLTANDRLELSIVPTGSVLPAQEAPAEESPIVASEQRRRPETTAETPQPAGDETAGEPEGAEPHPESEPPMPLAGSGGDTPPPQDPGETAEADQPDRGAALQQIIMAAGASSEIEYDGSVSVEESRIADEAELREARQVHREALRAIGMELHMGGQGLEPRIVDPAAFTAAMQALPTPDDNPEMAAYLHEQLNYIVDDALYNVASGVIRSDAAAAIEACGGIPLDTSPFRRAAEQTEPAPLNQVAGELPRHAAVLAEELSRTDADATDTEAMRQLGLAYRTGKLSLWAVAYDAGIIGQSAEQIGTDRLAHDEEWAAAYSILDHLRQTAPDAELTREIRTVLLRDITGALATPDTTPDPTANRPGFTQLQEELGVGSWQEERDKIAGRSRGLLLRALERIPQILPE